MHEYTYRRRLWEAVSTQWLPCLRHDGKWQAILAEPPFYLPPEIGLQYHPGKPLSAQNAGRVQKAAGYARNWPASGVHNTYAPYLGLLLDGEMDLRIGITREAARQLSAPAAHSDYASLSLHKNTFFLIPSGVPHGTGVQGHWERSTPPPSATRIFWIHFFAPGVQCHLSWNAPEGYISKGSFFLPDPHLWPAVNALTAEMRLRRESSTPIIHALLLFIGHNIKRDLKKLLAAEAAPLLPDSRPGVTSSQIVEQACTYIEAHYQEKLTVAQIAAHCFISPSHLSRLFKTAKGVTINDYLTRIRLGYASTLLQETEMGVHVIGRFAGYSNRAHFCQAFSRRFGYSPIQYRKRARLLKSEQRN